MMTGEAEEPIPVTAADSSTVDGSGELNMSPPPHQTTSGEELLSGAPGPIDPDGIAESTDGVPATDDATGVRSHIHRLLWRFGAYRRWSWYRAMHRESRREPSYWRDRDADENRQGQLPENESVELPVVWVCELYTPSTTPGLLEGVAKLGWEHGRSRNDSLVKWMSDVRHGRTAGWTNLGVVSPPNDPHVMSERTAQLPPGVRAALPTLMSVTPSITALVMAFMLTDDATRQLNPALRATYATRTERDPLYRRRHVLSYVLANKPMRLGRQIVTPDFARRDAVGERLSEHVGTCVQWVRKNVPGVFATGLRSGESPTAVLLVTESVQPLTGEARTTRALDGVALDRDFDAWESPDEWPAGRLVLARGWDSEGLRLTFACRRRDAFPRRDAADPTTNWSIAQRANDLVQGLLSRWALSCMLDGFHQSIAALRDQAAAGRSFRPVRDLRALRTLARSQLYDTAICAHELQEFAGNDVAFHYNVMEMRYARDVHGERPSLVNAFASSQAARAKQVQTEARLLADTLTTSGQLTQTISSIRVQRTALLLTLASIVVAVVAILVARSAVR